MGLNVMVLDDSAVMRKIVIRTLRQSGINVAEVLEGSSGQDGIQLLEAGHRPGLILSDVNMAGMDGITFVRNARKLVHQKTSKIVMITTESGQDKMREAMDAGANAYLTKPFTPEQVAESLKLLGID